MYVFISDFIAGYAGGILGLLVGHPLDTIKTCQQQANTKIVNTIYNILLRSNGITGFYKGMLYPLIANGSIYSVAFAVYGTQLRYLNHYHGEETNVALKNTNIFFAGSVAGFVQVLIACPTELIKVKLQTNTCIGGPLLCSKAIWRREGFFGFYRGVSPMLCRDAVPFGIYMMVYNWMLDYVATFKMVQEIREYENYSGTNSRFEMTVTAISGAIAGIVSWSMVAPFDVLKTRMQSQTDPLKRLTSLQTAQYVIKTSGWRALFRGTWMIILRAAPVNAATFLGYECCREVLHDFFGLR